MLARLLLAPPPGTAVRCASQPVMLFGGEEPWLDRQKRQRRQRRGWGEPEYSRIGPMRGEGFRDRCYGDHESLGPWGPTDYNGFGDSRRLPPRDSVGDRRFREPFRGGRGGFDGGGFRKPYPPTAVDAARERLEAAKSSAVAAQEAARWAQEEETAAQQALWAEEAAEKVREEEMSNLEQVALSAREHAEASSRAAAAAASTAFEAEQMATEAALAAGPGEVSRCHPCHHRHSNPPHATRHAPP